MNGNTDKKRKIMQSLSAFAFALTVFAANAQGSASAETLDSAANGLIVKTAAIESADNEGGEGSVMGKTTDSEANGDDADDISTNYDEEENGEGGQSEDADFTDVDSDTDEDDEAETELRSEAGTTAFLGKAAEYNVFVENNFTVNGADCPGNFAVGGNVTVPESYSAYKTVVGGTILGGSFLNGYTTADAEGIDFAVEFANLRATSAKLAAMVPNGYVTNGDWGAEMKFVGTNDDINVFTMSVSEYNSILANSYGQLKFTFDVPAGSVAIVNITGEGYLNMGVNCGTYYAGQAVSNGTANNANILFNVPDAYGVSIGTSMGNLLAPNADVTSIDIGGHPHFEGQLICKNYEGVNEFGGTQFVPDDPTAPDKGDNGDTDPDNPDGGDSGNTNPDTPSGGDSGNTNPDTPTGGDSGNTNPDTPTGGGSDNTNPDTPAGGDSGNTNPDTPTGGDSGNTDPDTPSGGDSGNTDPDTPTGGDSGNTNPDTSDNGGSGNTNPDTPDNGGSDNTNPGTSDSTTPDIPDNGDSGNTTPDTPDNGDSGNINPDTPNTGDHDSTTPDTPDTTPDVPTAPDTPNTSTGTSVTTGTSTNTTDTETSVTTETTETNTTYIEVYDSDVPLTDMVIVEDGDVPLTDFSAISNPKTGESRTPLYAAEAAAVISTIALAFATKRKYSGSKYSE